MRTPNFLSPTIVALSILLTCVITVKAGEFETASRAESKSMKAKVQAAQFLQHATFGPWDSTAGFEPEWSQSAVAESSIEDLANRIQEVGLRRACNEWIDRQFDDPLISPTPQTPEYASIGSVTDATELSHQGLAQYMIFQDGYESTDNSVWIQRYRYHAWWHKAIRGRDQLRQRVAWALSQILVTSEDGSGFNDAGAGNGTTDGGDPPEKYPIGRWLGPSNYYDTLVKHSFGNYKDLLEEVTFHPIMGVYLSHMRNRKAPPDNSRAPDENYAREIMQLFSIGLYELHDDGRLKETVSGDLIPTYDNDTIKSFARVFTGLTFVPNATNNWSQFESGNDFTFPMQMYHQEHDTDPKIVFPGTANEVTIDAESQTSFSKTSAAYGDYEIKKAVEILFNHDNVGPFIAYRLIQRLVKSNPSRAYIRRVAEKFNNNGSGVRGDMKVVVKAILLDPEAFRSIRVRAIRNPSKVVVEPRGTEYSRLQEPVMRYAAFLRGSKVTSNDPFQRIMITPTDWVWQQEPYKSPSVFNFFLPGYQPPGDLIGFQPTRRIPNGNLVAPEYQQKTSVTSNYLQQKYIWDIGARRAQFWFNNTSCIISMRLEDEIASIDTVNSISDTTARNAAMLEKIAEVVDKYDLVYCSGTIPQDYKDEVSLRIREGIKWMGANANVDGSGRPWQDQLGEHGVESALLTVITSPFCAIAE